MYLVRGTLDELTANLGPFCRIDCSPLFEGLAGQVDNPFLSDDVSVRGVFLYLGCYCRWLNFFIWRFLVILNTFSLVLCITSTISLKSLLLDLRFMLVLILLMCVCSLSIPHCFDHLLGAKPRAPSSGEH